MSLLPVVPAHRLAVLPEARRWLVEGIWSEEAVGIVGGEPKCCKSFLGLETALAVASGTPWLRRFPVPHPGRVLLFAAEDPLHVVRARLDGLCRFVGLELAALDIQVITADSLRIDLEADRDRLAATVAALQPRLLILDPFVRLHRADENASGEVAPMLAFLRDLQRSHHTAVLVVHHAKKGAGRVRDGQALRGSSEFHAWGDSNLYLRRRGEDLLLSVEHRAAPSLPGVGLRLESAGDTIGFVFSDNTAPIRPAPLARNLAEEVKGHLATSPAPLPIARLQKLCRVRTDTLCQVLAGLGAAGTVARTAKGYVLTTAPARP